jgi:hypothetical protein
VLYLHFVLAGQLRHWQLHFVFVSSFRHVCKRNQQRQVVAQKREKTHSGQGGEYYAVNGISVAQGPNYALAKRMQHWQPFARAGMHCSSDIAPSTSTRVVATAPLPGLTKVATSSL